MIQQVNHLNLQQEIGLLKIWVEILLKINKNKLKISTDLKRKYSQKVNIVKNLLIMLNSLLQMHLKLLQKEH